MVFYLGTTPPSLLLWRFQSAHKACYFVKMEVSAAYSMVDGTRPQLVLGGEQVRWAGDLYRLSRGAFPPPP